MPRLFILLTILSVSISSNADLVYDNGQPGKINDSYRGLFFDGRTLADDFVLENDENMTGVTFWGLGQMRSGFDQIGVGFASSNNGDTPGNYIATTSIVPTSIFDTGIDVPASGAIYHLFKVTLHFDAVQLFANTKYWLTLQYDRINSEALGDIAWIATDMAVKGSSSRLALNESLWVGGFDIDLAYQLNASAVVTPLPVPTPTIISLLLVSVFGLWLNKRSNKS